MLEARSLRQGARILFLLGSQRPTGAVRKLYVVVQQVSLTEDRLLPKESAEPDAISILGIPQKVIRWVGDNLRSLPGGRP